MSGSCFRYIPCGCTDLLSIQVQLHLCRVGVNVNRYFSSVYQKILLVPALGNHMKGRLIFSPLAGVEVEGILGEACRIDHSEIGGVGHRLLVAAHDT